MAAHIAHKRTRQLEDLPSYMSLKRPRIAKTPRPLTKGLTTVEPSSRSLHIYSSDVELQAPSSLFTFAHGLRQSLPATILQGEDERLQLPLDIQERESPWNPALHSLPVLKPNEQDAKATEKIGARKGKASGEVSSPACIQTPLDASIGPKPNALRMDLQLCIELPGACPER